MGKAKSSIIESLNDCINTWCIKHDLNLPPQYESTKLTENF